MNLQRRLHVRRASQLLSDFFLILILITNLLPNEAVSLAVHLSLAQKGSAYYNEIN